MLLPTYKKFQLPAEQRKALFGSNSGITTKRAYSMYVQSHTHTESSEVGGTVINLYYTNSRTYNSGEFLPHFPHTRLQHQSTGYINSSQRSINEYCPGVQQRTPIKSN